MPTNGQIIGGVSRIESVAPAFLSVALLSTLRVCVRARACVCVCVSTTPASGSTVTPLHVVRLNVGMIGASCDSLDAAGIPDYSWLPLPTAPGADYYFRTYDQGFMLRYNPSSRRYRYWLVAAAAASSTRESKLFRPPPLSRVFLFFLFSFLFFPEKFLFLD